MAFPFHSLARRLTRKRAARAPHAEITISMVVAIYNVAPYLDAFLKSVMDQQSGVGGLEVILVNDGATDESGAMADDWAKRYPTVIRVLHQSNQGVAKARNAGLAVAGGVWVCFPDPDDRISANYLDEVRDEITKATTSTPLAIVTNLLQLDDATGTVSDTHRLRYRFTKKVSRHDSREPGWFLLAHTHCTIMHRASLMRHNLQFEPKIRPSFEDAVLINRLLLHEPDRQISFLREPIYYYRQRQDQSSLTDRASRDLNWYGPHLRNAYLPLLEEAIARRGHVPRFVQLIILLSLTAKLAHIVSPRFDDTLLDSAARHDFLTALAEVMERIETDTLRNPDVPNFRMLQCAALLARYKNAPQPVSHANLVPASRTHDFGNPDAMKGLWLRWQSGGAAPIDLRVQLDGHDVPNQKAYHDPVNLLGSPYIHHSRLWVPCDVPSKLLVLRGAQGDVPVRFKGQTLDQNNPIPQDALIG